MINRECQIAKKYEYKRDKNCLMYSYYRCSLNPPLKIMGTEEREVH